MATKAIARVEEVVRTTASDDTQPIIYTEQPPEKMSYFHMFESTGWNEDYHLTPDELFEALSNSWRMIHAYRGRDLIGSGRVVSDGILHALVVDVIVLPACQEEGIGTEIVRRLLEECTKSGIRDVQLFCAWGKVPFYERLGFRARPIEAPGMQLQARATTPRQFRSGERLR